MPHSSLRPSQRLAPRCGQYWSMTPTTPRLSRNASNSSPITTIFFGGPSASGNSADSDTGSQNRRNSSPMPVPAPLSVRNLLSSARSMACPPDCCLLLVNLDPGQSARQRGPLLWPVRPPSRQPSHPIGDLLLENKAQFKFL